MDESTKQSKLDNRLEISPTDYAIETFTPDFKEGQKYKKVPVKISGNAILKGLKIIITLITCGWIAILLWNTKHTPAYSKYSQGRFKTSNLEESIKQIEEVPLPENINSESTEKYYLALSKICRTFFKEIFYIKATEMTSDELAQHFKLIGIESELVNSWIVVSNSADMAKYAKQIPHIDQFNVDKNNFINLIKSFHNIQNSVDQYN